MQAFFALFSSETILGSLLKMLEANSDWNTCILLISNQLSHVIKIGRAHV